MGSDNISLLNKTNFDKTLLQTATDTANALAEILARSTSIKAENSKTKTLRNKAYSYLKQHVDEVRRYGRFVFRKDKFRIVGYQLHYKRDHRYRTM